MYIKHTPGPWVCPYGSRIYGADGLELAATAYAHRGTNETEANAALIAAAPELLIAFENLVNEIEAYQSAGEITGYFSLKNAHAAIAKAKGAA